jgi:hypothetical protein
LDAKVDVDDSSWELAGVPTGPVSNIDAIDIDPPDGPNWLQRNALPETRVHRSPRGLHLIFRHSPGLRCSKGQIAKDVDVRGDGGFIIWWPRERYPVVENDIAELPEWLLRLAMGAKVERTRPQATMQHRGLIGGPGVLAKLNVLDYGEHDDWLRLMMACHAAGIDKEEFIDWSVGDPKYSQHAEVISRRWDSLEIVGGVTPRALRVELRLAQLNRGVCPKHPCTPAQWACLWQGPHEFTRTINVQSRVNYYLSAIKGDEKELFKSACAIREIIAEDLISPSVAIQLLESSWPIENGAKAWPLTSLQAVRRVIASGFQVMENDRLVRKASTLFHQAKIVVEGLQV